MKHTHLIAGTLLAAIAAHPLTAQNVVWTGDGDGSSWNDGDNWDNDLIPTVTTNIANMDGADVTIGAGVAAVALKLENGGITGGELTVESTGSLTITSSLEINRRNGSGLLTVDGGTVTTGAGATFITHYADNDAPETGISEGTLRVTNGGSYTTNQFRSDGGVSKLIIEGAGTTVNSGTGNDSFTNSDTAVTHFSMSGDATTSFNTGTGRDFWGGAGSTFAMSGGVYTHGGDQFYFQTRANGSQTVTITGGKLTTVGTLYGTSGTDGSIVINQSGGEIEITGVNKDFNLANSDGSTVEYNISGDATLDLERHLNMNRANATYLFTIEGENVVFDIAGQVNANSADTTIGFIFTSGGVTALAAEGNISITGAALELDLSAYSDVNGDVLLLDSNTGSISGTFASTDFGGTGIGTLDYGTSGQLWLRDISVIPEPGTFALLAGLTGLTFVALRRRR